jgi:hypothetical protein
MKKTTELKDIAEVFLFVSDVLGDKPARHFEEEMDNFLYYVKMSALTNPDMTETWMKSKLKKYAEAIIMESIESYLDCNFSDDIVDGRLNIGYGMVYDKDLNPIDAVNRFKDSQRIIIRLMVSAGMFEFERGRDLAYSMIERADHEDAQAEVTVEDLVAERDRLETKLPNITKDDVAQLLYLYKTLKTLGV